MRGGNKGGQAGSDGEGLGGVVRGLGGFLDLLSRLAEQGSEIQRSGEIGDDKKGVKAVYGFSMRVGGGREPRMEPFGNVRRSQGKPVVDECREPIADVFDEEGQVLVVAEMPGVEAGDVSFEVRGDVLALSATHGDRKYRKELAMPCAVRVEGAKSSFRNGVFELRLPKA